MILCKESSKLVKTLNLVTLPFVYSTISSAGTMLLEREAATHNWRKTFMELQSKELNSEKFCSLSTKIGESSKNKYLNRYYNVLAYDHSRVIIHHNEEELYINANLIKVPQAKREYILTQGPLQSTVDDFWLMVFEKESSTILMLCNCIESDRDKSWKYWPDKGETLILGDKREGIGLEVCLDDSEDNGHYIIRTLTLTHVSSGVKRTIKQFHYIDWPDFNVPDSPDNFLEFLLEVRKTDCFVNSGPPIVHCSAGIGRSGTLVLVDSCLVLATIEQLSLRKVLQVLMEMRTFRVGLIQTEDQLKFSVSAIVQGSKLLGISQGVHVNGKRLAESNDSIRDEQSSPKKQKSSDS